MVCLIGLSHSLSYISLIDCLIIVSWMVPQALYSKQHPAPGLALKATSCTFVQSGANDVGGGVRSVCAHTNRISWSTDSTF